MNKGIKTFAGFVSTVVGTLVVAGFLLNFFTSNNVIDSNDNPFQNSESKFQACLAEVINAERLEELKDNKQPTNAEYDVVNKCYLLGSVASAINPNWLGDNPFASEDPELQSCLQGKLDPERLQFLSAGKPPKESSPTKLPLVTVLYVQPGVGPCSLL